jgi:hypothetical protein
MSKLNNILLRRRNQLPSSFEMLLISSAQLPEDSYAYFTEQLRHAYCPTRETAKHF